MRPEKVEGSIKSVSQLLVRLPLAFRSGPRGTERRRPTTQDLVLLNNIPKVKIESYTLSSCCGKLHTRIGKFTLSLWFASDNREIGLYGQLLWFHKATITNMVGRYQQFSWVRLSSQTSGGVLEIAQFLPAQSINSQAVRYIRRSGSLSQSRPNPRSSLSRSEAMLTPA
jgi:hypothetical protein